MALRDERIPGVKELRSMCENAERVARLCALFEGRARMGTFESDYDPDVPWSSVVDASSSAYDPDVHPYAWEL